MEDRPRYRNGILVYTAADIHDDVSAGMDPDCLFVGLEKYDALRAELARVKAESLRVVVDGEACGYGVWLEQQSSTAFLLDDEVNVHVNINRYQSANGGPSAPIEGDTIVQPVRLERWEDE